MQSRLIVKNFGPITNVDLELKNVNVFIGPQASGKSALAKLLTICKAPAKFLKNEDSDNFKAFKDVLEEYNIQSFLKPGTEIQFDSEIHNIKYANGSVAYLPKLKLEIAEIKSSIEAFKNSVLIDIVIHEKINKLQEKYKLSLQDWQGIDILDADEIKLDLFQKIVAAATEIEELASSRPAVYIPAERSFINIVRGSIASLLLNHAPIPRHILLFASEIEKSLVNEIDLSFLHEHLMYRNINGEAKIFTNGESSIKLTEAASGIQSVVPLLLSVLSNDSSNQQRSFVIEEPELNLFPTAQYQLVKILEANRGEAHTLEGGAIHTYTTHSPYILSAFNNLLYASKVWNLRGDVNSSKLNPGRYDPEIETKLRAIIPAKSNVQPSVFTAYEIVNGGARSIFDTESGLIVENYIDDATDEMNDDFEALMELMK